MTDRKINVKIIPDATVLKENKYGKSLCDIDALWCQKEMADSCYISKISDPTVHQNCTELTRINNEEIVYTLLNIFKYWYNTKETNKKRIK